MCPLSDDVYYTYMTLQAADPALATHSAADPELSDSGIDLASLQSWHVPRTDCSRLLHGGLGQ